LILVFKVRQQGTWIEIFVLANKH